MSEETPRRARSRRYELIGAGILFLIVGAYFARGTFTSYMHQRAASQTFVPVDATVVSAELVTRGGNRTTQGESAVPRIVYRYTVDGKEYTGERYYFTGQGWSDQTVVQAVVNWYRGTGEIQAFVDPQNPSVAVLDPSEPSAGMFWFLVPLLGLSGLAIYWGMRGKARD